MRQLHEMALKRLELLQFSQVLRYGVLLNGFCPDQERWSYFLTQPAKVDSPMQRMIHDENAETVFG